MKRNEYLEDAFKKFNEGKISAEAYDAMISNINIFCEEDEEMEENNMNKKLYVYKEWIYEVIDETPTHFVCSPKNTNEGYGYIPKEKTFSLEEHEEHFDLSNRNLEEMRKYNQWITKEGYPDYGIFACLECGKYIFGRGKNETPICEECKNKDKFYILVRFCDGACNMSLYKKYADAYKDMENQIKKEACDYSDYYEDVEIDEHFDDGMVSCFKKYGFVSGNVSQEDVHWFIEEFDLKQINN